MERIKAEATNSYGVHATASICVLACLALALVAPSFWLQVACVAFAGVFVAARLFELIRDVYN